MLLAGCFITLQVTKLCRIELLDNWCTVNCKGCRRNWREVIDGILSSTVWRLRQKLQKPVSTEGSRIRSEHGLPEHAVRAVITRPRPSAPIILIAWLPYHTATFCAYHSNCVAPLSHCDLLRLSFSFRGSLITPRPSAPIILISWLPYHTATFCAYHSHFVAPLSHCDLLRLSFSFRGSLITPRPSAPIILITWLSYHTATFCAYHSNYVAPLSHRDLLRLSF
jgi:hypothetical protein